MCLIAWNWQPHCATPLLLLANRDEFYARPALPLHWWEPAANGTQILAGKDLQGGGTWLGLSRTGRLAALTNFRSGAPQRTNTPSRGELVAAFLHGDQSAEDYLRQLAEHCGDYNPFNLLVFDGHQLMGLESRGAKVLSHAPGLGAVSNADFHTPWAKLTQLRSRLAALPTNTMADLRQLLPLLHDQTVAPDAALPTTGVPLELERMLSAAFIATSGYGTRACSVLALHHNRAEFMEQSFGLQGLISEAQLQFSF
jgi:uncharacterized protein with NRDE domain